MTRGGAVLVGAFNTPPGDPIPTGCGGPRKRRCYSGVRETLVAVDTTIFSAAVSTLPALPKAHQFAFLSVDNVLNREPTGFQEVMVDTTPPSTRISPDGTGFITSMTTILLRLRTRFQAGSRLGVSRTFFGVDGSMADFAEGSTWRREPYGRLFQRDRVSNRELERRTTFSWTTPLHYEFELRGRPPSRSPGTGVCVEPGEHYPRPWTLRLA